ncbi:hypothetical protein J2T57_001320 [Natronocella acetinitrilica]|uniref:Uncharacterized protein n=1 Tax=Natronocella acetinitrilica TaxID=414046 RepID=A0AAE3G4G8_9GAMM|nr:hypothetical protein [Natronocella acetinitrilica]MCP1674218.1 hypothetical protein [Natronocella acetinitrilica]
MSSPSLERALADALARLDTGSRSERNNEIALNYFGLDGRGGCSMQSAGTPHGLTRESVRQITNRVAGALRAAPGEIPGVLGRAHAVIEDLIPMAADALEAALVARGIITPGFRIEGVLRAFDVLDAPAPEAAVYSVDERRVVLSEADIPHLEFALSRARQLVPHNGACGVEALASALPGALQWEHRLRIVRAAANLRADVVWVCDGAWFFFGATGRNRLLRNLDKLFSVCEAVDIESVHQALSRAWNKAPRPYSKMVTIEALRGVIAQSGRFVIDDQGIVRALAPCDPTVVLPEMEFALARFLAGGTDLMRREKEMEDALVGEPTAKFGFSMALNYAPFVGRIEKEPEEGKGCDSEDGEEKIEWARGIYRLAGTPRAETLGHA